MSFLCVLFAPGVERKQADSLPGSPGSRRWVWSWEPFVVSLFLLALPASRLFFFLLDPLFPQPSLSVKLSSLPGLSLFSLLCSPTVSLISGSFSLPGISQTLFLCLSSPLSASPLSSFCPFVSLSLSPHPPDLSPSTTSSRKPSLIPQACLYLCVTFLEPFPSLQSPICNK